MPVVIAPDDREVEAPKTETCSRPDVEMLDNTEALESQTFIFFDWDDTLLPATFLSKHGLNLENPCREREVLRHLQTLSRIAANLLRTAMQYGQVTIVTNAEETWVERSCQMFLPELESLIQQVQIISARTRFECHHPNSPLQWKLSAFKEVLASSAQRRNVISFGDSNVERLAMKSVTQALALTTTKSVKFCEKPTLEQLKRQLELIRQCFDYLHDHDKDLDLMLTIEMVYKN